MEQSAHPADLELSRWFDGRLDPDAAERVQTHLEHCLPCRVHVGQARPVGGHALEQAEVTELVDAAQRLPEQAIAAFATPRTIQRAPGQLWRLEWRGRTALALLLADVEDDRALVAPVTTDPAWGDEHTLAVSSALSPLGIELAVWTALRTHVDEPALDQPFGETDPSVVETVQLVHDASVRGELVDDQHLPAGLAVGTPISDRADERWEYRQHVTAELTGLVEQERADLAPTEQTRLGALLYEYGIGPTDVAETLGVSPSTVFALLHGAASLDEDQLRLLVERLDLPEAELRATGARLDPDAHRALSLPQTRDRLETEARRRNQRVADLKEECIEWSLALAARHTGEQRDPVAAWERIIHEWLDTPR